MRCPRPGSPSTSCRASVPTNCGPTAARATRGWYRPCRSRGACSRARACAFTALALEEERRTVFREEVKAGGRNQSPRRDAPPADMPWRRRVTPDAVLLFRFSALTFNSHRIHYDRTWAMQTEGYPGLVVHGPLTTTLLLDFARDSNPGRTIRSYTTQARAPLFDTAPFELVGRPSADGRGAQLWAVTPEGTIAMSAEIGLD